MLLTSGSADEFVPSSAPSTRSPATPTSWSPRSPQPPTTAAKAQADADGGRGAGAEDLRRHRRAAGGPRGEDRRLPAPVRRADRRRSSRRSSRRTAARPLPAPSRGRRAQRRRAGGGRHGAGPGRRSLRLGRRRSGRVRLLRSHPVRLLRGRRQPAALERQPVADGHPRLARRAAARRPGVLLQPGQPRGHVHRQRPDGARLDRRASRSRSPASTRWAATTAPAASADPAPHRPARAGDPDPGSPALARPSAGSRPRACAGERGRSSDRIGAVSARRAALVAALVLGVALAVVIAVRTPWHLLPTPPGGHTPVDPTAGLSAGRRSPGRRPSPPRCGRRRWSRSCWASSSPACSASPRSAAAWSAPSPRPLGGGWVWQVLLGVLALEVSAGWSPCRWRPTARWSGTATGCPPAAGGCGCATSPSRPAINAGLTALGLLALVCARPPGARGPGGPGRALGAAGARRRRVLPLPVVIEPAFNRFESMPAGAAAHATCCALAERERHAGAGRAGRRRLPADDGAQRLRLGLRLDPADRRLRHGARRSCPTTRSSRSSRTSSATWPPTTSSPAR